METYLDYFAINGYLHGFPYSGKDDLEKHSPSKELTHEDFVEEPSL